MEKRKLTWYNIAFGIFMLAFQHGMYLLGHEISLVVGSAAFCPKTLLDDAFPVLSVFILPYVWSYAYWAMGPMAVSRCEKSHYYDFIAAYFAALLLGTVLLAVFPTYMDRELENLYAVRSQPFDGLRRFWYTLDGATIAYNLLPSFHCLNSTLCYAGVAGRKEIPLWFRIYSLVMTVTIFFSTLFVKQHYIPDVFAGIAVALIPYLLAKKYHWGRAVEPVVAAIFKKEGTKE